MSTLQNVKIKINELGKGEVYLDDKPLQTTGTKVITRSNDLPEVTIYTIGDTIDQEITTSDITIVEAELCLRIWDYKNAPKEYQSLSFAEWDYCSWIMRMPKRGGPGELVDRLMRQALNSHSDIEVFDIGELYSVTIWGHKKK